MIKIFDIYFEFNCMIKFFEVGVFFLFISFIREFSLIFNLRLKFYICV